MGGNSQKQVKSADIHIRVSQSLKKDLVDAVHKKSRETGIELTISQYLVGVLERMFKRRH